MRIWILGVRGSCPAPGPDFVRVGGNTSCVALGHDEGVPRLLLDAGTGIRGVADLLGDAPFAGTLLLGHLHWDHLMGLPFFQAGDRPDANVHLRVPANAEGALAVLSRAMSPPLFPITPEELRGNWRFDGYDEGRFSAEGFEILAREVPHKGGRTMGLRIGDGRHSVAYLSDHAPQQLGPGHDQLGVLHDAALELADGVDVLFHDAQYTAAELPERGAFGHAAAEYAVELGRTAGARRVLLFHHDPGRTDAEVDEITAAVQYESGPIVEAATEGVCIDL